MTQCNDNAEEHPPSRLEDLSEAQSARVGEAVEEYLAAVRRGEKPDRQAFLACHADIAGPLGECLDGLEMVDATVAKEQGIKDGGPAGSPRQWAFVQLGAAWYVREPLWKLNRKGELFDMKQAPFEEKPIPADTQDAEALAARKRLQAVLDRLNPAAGKTVPPGTEKPRKAAAKKTRKKKQQTP
jgi:hypothetical protein